MTDASADWDLVERVKAGDDRAFDALLARYRRSVLNFVYRMTGNAADAEDVAQGVFVRAYQAIQKPSVHRTGAAFSTWLFQVARNAALDDLRRRRRHPAESLDVIQEHGDLAGAVGTSRDTVSGKETGAQIAAAVALLPEDQRATFILAEYEDLGYAEVAAILDCSEKSVESRLYRARHFLRERLAHLLTRHGSPT